MKQLFGMIHLQALPGTPANCLAVDAIVKQAVNEAKILLSSGFDGLIIENMHDVPYLNREVGPEIVAAMTLASHEIRKITDKPLGIQVLAGANKAALAIALAANLNFIRAEGFVFAHVADEGYMDAQAGELMRYRKNIGAEKIKVYTDIKKKHSSHAITADVSLKESVEAAELFLSDGIIITGSSTGKSVDLNELKTLSKSNKIPLFLGSGITNNNISNYWNHADGFIIGSYLKKEGVWSNDLDLGHLDKIMNTVNKLRNGK